MVPAKSLLTKEAYESLKPEEQALYVNKLQ